MLPLFVVKTQALRVLGTPDSHPAMQRGTISLLETETKLSNGQTVGTTPNDIPISDLSGNWVTNADFYKRYIPICFSALLIHPNLISVVTI
jgi:hypothetical protein